MSTKKIKILMADGESNFSLKTLRCLGLVPNLETMVLSSQKWNPIRFSRHHAGFYYHNATGFDEKRLDVIIEYAKKLKPDIIFPVEHNTIRLLSAHREELAPFAALPGGAAEVPRTPRRRRRQRRLRRCPAQAGRQFRQRQQHCAAPAIRPVPLL